MSSKAESFLEEEYEFPKCWYVELIEDVRIEDSLSILERDSIFKYPDTNLNELITLFNSLKSDNTVIHFTDTNSDTFLTLLEFCDFLGKTRILSIGVSVHVITNINPRKFLYGDEKEYGTILRL